MLNNDSLRFSLFVLYDTMYGVYDRFSDSDCISYYSKGYYYSQGSKNQRVFPKKKKKSKPVEFIRNLNGIDGIEWVPLSKL